MCVGYVFAGFIVYLVSVSLINLYPGNELCHNCSKRSSGVRKHSVGKM